MPQHIMMRIGIVGLGLMRGSLAMALRTLRPDWELVGHDTDQATLARALEQGLVSTGPVREVDLLVLAAPIPALPELLADLGGHPGVVTDVASTKARVMSWATAAGVDLVGGHPMCGRELSGLAAAATNFCFTAFRGPCNRRDDELPLESSVHLVHICSRSVSCSDSTSRASCCPC